MYSRYVAAELKLLNAQWSNTVQFSVLFSLLGIGENAKIRLPFLCVLEHMSASFSTHLPITVAAIALSHLQENNLIISHNWTKE